MIQLIITFIIFIFFLIYLYIRLKYRFWYLQPVFHLYDFNYYFSKPFIIRKELPLKNKFTNFKDIEFLSFNKIDKNKLNEFICFIQQNYLKNKDNHFNPKLINIEPYFTNHFAESFISFYYKEIFLEDLKTNQTIPYKKLISVMTSRPLHVYIKNKLLDAYYVDYLCVDKLCRKKNIASQMIQTHEYCQSHWNKNIAVSLFKREGNLTGIIPICVYNTYCFNMHNWLKPVKLQHSFHLLKGNRENIYYLFNFINLLNKKWDLKILCDISNLINLVETNNIFIYMIMDNKDIKAVFFFRRVCTSISKDKEVLSCFASIKNEISDELFINGFKNAIFNIINDNKIFYYLCLENLSDNFILLNNLLIKSTPILISPTAYFFYNFVYNTIKLNKILIIN